MRRLAAHLSVSIKPMAEGGRNRLMGRPKVGYAPDSCDKSGANKSRQSED